MSGYQDDCTTTVSGQTPRRLIPSSAVWPATGSAGDEEQAVETATRVRTVAAVRWADPWCPRWRPNHDELAADLTAVVAAVVDRLAEVGRVSCRPG